MRVPQDEGGREKRTDPDRSGQMRTASEGNGRERTRAD